MPPTTPQVVCLNGYYYLVTFDFYVFYVVDNGDNYLENPKYKNW